MFVLSTFSNVDIRKIRIHFFIFFLQNYAVTDAVTKLSEDFKCKPIEGKKNFKSEMKVFMVLP